MPNPANTYLFFENSKKTFDILLLSQRKFKFHYVFPERRHPINTFITSNNIEKFVLEKQAVWILGSVKNDQQVWSQA